MSYFDMFTYWGNVKRIILMHEGGMGPNAISGVFKDFGIEITPEFCRETAQNYEAMKKLALPKKVANSAIAAMNKDKDSYNPNGNEQPT